MSHLHVFIFSCHNLLHVTSSFIFFLYKTQALQSPFATPSSLPAMASNNASLFLAFLLLFSTSFARQQQFQQCQNQCQIQNIEALQPYDVLQAEAGLTEFWDANNQQFQCAGVDFVRHRIQPGGLLLPSYVNTPILAFIERGGGVHGVILPGCPETYEYLPDQQFSPQGQRGQGQRGGQRSQFQDRHQKVENLNEGDVVAIPTGAAHWLHNDGNSELVAVVFFDTQNKENQLDENHRRFFLAGNPQAQSQQHQQQQPGRRQQGQSQQQHQQQPGRRQQGQSQQHQQQGQSQQHQRQGRQRQGYWGTGNIFSGFGLEFIAEAFNVDMEIAEKLQGQRDQRGHIVDAGQHLEIIRPQQTPQEYGGRGSRQGQRGGGQGRDPWEQGRRGGGQGRGPWEQGRGGSGGWSNGVEETICSMKLRENIDNPSHADFVNPEAGRISNLNSFKFPVLQLLQLSAERGELHRNAIQSPHWIFNAHNLLYVTDGSMRVQIVNNEGNSVFDDELQQGQVVVIPQNFAVIKRASEQGCRWVSFRTNDNAMISNLAGRVSAIRSLPVDVVANSYQLSREDAERLKFSQQQAVLFTPSGVSRGGRRATA